MTGVQTCALPISGVTYSFDNGTTFQPTASKGGLAAATTYQVVVKDNTSFCVSTATPSVINAILTVPTAPTTTVTQPTCGVTTGTITVTAPSTGVTYSFDNGTTFQPTASKSGLAAATTYQVVVKDNTSLCTSTATPSVINAILTVPTAPTTSVTQPTCGVTTGTITVTVPSSGVSYSFDNGTTFQATASKSGLAAATTYQVIVKDNTSLCTSTATPSVVNAILTVPTAPTTTVTQPTCGVTTGTITVTVPSSGVSYSFDNGTTFQPAASKSGLAAATTYQVIVKDDVSNCLSTATATVINAILTVPTAPTTSVTQPTCGVTTGTITVTSPSTGVTYSFDNGATFQASATSSALVSGAYQVVVKDDVSNCVSTATATVVTAQPTTPTIGSVSKTNPTIVTCPMLNDGTITVTATGSNIEYSKDNGVSWQPSGLFTGLTAASYTLKVRNSVSTCGATHTTNPVVLTAPTCPVSCVVPKPSIVNH